MLVLCAVIIVDVDRYQTIAKSLKVVKARRTYIAMTGIVTQTEKFRIIIRKEFFKVFKVIVFHIF